MEIAATYYNHAAITLCGSLKVVSFFKTVHIVLVDQLYSLDNRIRAVSYKTNELC